MGWSSSFLAALATTRRAPSYLLEVLIVADEPGDSYTVRSVPGVHDDVALGVRGVSVQGQTLSPRGWSSTIGAWSVQVVGDISELCAHLTRGTIVRLRAGFDGMSDGDYETIAVGQVQNLRGVAPVWTLEVLDLYSACRGRLEVVRSLNYLFAGTGISTTLSTNYTAGDLTLEVASTSSFRRESGGSGAAKVTPTTGDPFYLTWTGTGTGPTRFTGVSTTGACGTTAVDAVAGDAVTEVVYLSGHPLDIARQILCSTGAGTNGSYDVYPSGWGLGITDSLLDQGDISTWRDVIVQPSSGSVSWEFIVEEAQEDAYSWLQSFLSPGGFFLLLRQGLLTVRAAQDTQAAPYHSDVIIDDDDIVSVEEYEAWDASHSPEYTWINCVTASANVGITVSDAATLPQSETLTYDLSDRVFSNDSAVCQEVLNRVAESATRVPERVVLRCAGLRLAQLCPGDVVDVSTVRVHSRRDGSAGYGRRRAMVDEVSPDWDGGTVNVGLLVYPEDEDMFS